MLMYLTLILYEYLQEFKLLTHHSYFAYLLLIIHLDTPSFGSLHV